MSTSSYLILIQLLLLISNSLALTNEEVKLIYDEVEAMNASCPFDSCSDRGGVLHQTPSLSCDCDGNCWMYDSCCLDSPNRHRQASRYPGKCAEVNTKSQDKVYMIETCKPGWSNDDAKKLCQADAAINNDPRLMIPVTSQQTYSTYRNYFCAACNNDDDYAVSWTVEFFSGSTQVLKTLDDLRFDRILTQWTVRDAKGSYIPVNIRLRIPQGLTQVVRRCRYGMINDCPIEWTDEAVRKKCRAYLARMYVKSDSHTVNQYKNPHCALCNEEDLTKMICNVYGDYESERCDNGLKDVMFVGLFVMEDSNKVCCPENMIYDTLSKKCRKFKCPRNKKLEKGKCVDM